MIRLPYRLGYHAKHPFMTLSCIWSDIRNGVLNLIRWLPIIWFDRDWDWVYLVKLMEYKLDRMSRAIGENDIHKGSERKAKQLRMSSELCKRLLEDKYLMVNNGAPEIGPWGRFSYGKMFDKKENKSYWDYMLKQDQELLFKIMNKHLRGWWD